MIGAIEGVVKVVRAGFCIISASGVGYKVAVKRESLARIKPGKEVSLWTHLAVRENALDLYGFETEEELRFFELLLTVSGIGPKSGLAILDLAPVETLRSAIAGGNAAYLTKVSGVGKKTGEKIVVELKDKVGAHTDMKGAMRGDEEALEAMHALGYTLAEAREALRKVPQEVERGSDRLRDALRIIGKRE